MSFNWNNAAENAIAGALGMVPEVGSLLSALVYIFWPESGEDIWAEIENKVEQLIKQDIDKFEYERIQNNLAGLNNNIDDYLSAVQTGDPMTISQTWISTDNDFDQHLPSFQAQGYELLLLPLFAQFANINLTLLRDGVLFGSTWGWNKEYQESILKKLTTRIKAYVEYANKVYQKGYQNIANKTPANNHLCQPFRSLNAYTRQMTVTVLDFVQLWPYFDTTKYPEPVSIHLDREIYSDPAGACDNSGPVNLPSPPTQLISQITVWAWDRIDAVQLTYPPGGGPGGVTQTARMGDQNGGSNQSPHGGVFNVSDNPVTVTAGFAGEIVGAFNFTFKNGSSTGQLGNNYPGSPSFSFDYTGEILSSIHINGVSSYYGSADCAVFGFKFEHSQKPNPDTLRLLYVTSPSEVTLDKLAQQSVTKAIGIEELTAYASAQGWEAQRREYRKYLKSRAGK